MIVERGDLVKAWNEGNLELGIVYSGQNTCGLIEYNIIRTIIAGADFNPEFVRCINSYNNVVKNFGEMSVSEHKEEHPEEWV